MTLVQAIILSILQGASELFPVSSLGHAIVLPVLLGWKNFDATPTGPFLPFLVVLHLGTALALIVFYWSEWKSIVGSFFRQFSRKRGEPRSLDAHIANLLLIGTIPAALIAFVLEKKLRTLFSSPRDAAILLIVNGIIMIGGEMVRRAADGGSSESRRRETVATSATDEPEASSRAGSRRRKRLSLDRVGWESAFLIGVAQASALLPGISRSGVTITGGLLARLRHADAARFAFLLATPIILLAGIAEVPKLAHHHGSVPHIGEYSAIGFVLSGLTAYASVKFLTRYFETNRLSPFGYYCIALGAIVLAVMHTHP